MKDWAYQRIKRNILNSSYPPGVSLFPDKLAQEFGVSRTPIREAFLKLTEEGLIYTKPRVGTFVSEISKADVLHMFEIRAVLEGYGLEHSSTTLSQDEVEKLTSLLVACETVISEDDWEAFVEHDVQFHDTLIEGFPNPWIKKIIASLEDLTIRERFLARRSYENFITSLDEHYKILEALKNGDWGCAGERMKEHWYAIRDRFIEDHGKE